MELKSLLTAAVVMCASASAFAFPELSLYPEPGDIDDVQYFASVNILNNDVTIADDKALPYFDNLDYGDTVTADAFKVFNGSIIAIFDETLFTENGQWELVFPAGCLEDANGEKNPKLTFSYNLNDPNVGIGEYPQITLVSSDPASGSKLPSWGDYIGQVKFVTSNDAAVNYIGWELWDVTNGTEEGLREWITQGNENRIDVNRRGGKDDDYWVNGLYIEATGDYKLLEGHTYHLALKFCGIGYDPVTNQYPTPIQLEKSLELETYIEFIGQTKPTEYSPYTVENIMPDPLEYEFTDLDKNSFTIVYSGPVKPESFTTPVFGGDNLLAGTFQVGTDVETVGDGYATTWEFFIDKDILIQAVGSLTVVIKAQDQDGLYVKGTGGFDINDFEYVIDWQANAGAPKLTMVDPEDGAILKELSSITISNDANKVMDLAWNAESNPRIIARDGSVDLELDNPVFSDDQLTATFTFEPIVKPGVYTLIIYKGYINMGTEYDGTTNSQANFTFTIEGEEPKPGDVVVDIVPESASIQDNAVLTEPLTSIVLKFAEVTYVTLDPPVPGTLYRKADNGDEFVVVEATYPVENDFQNPTEYTFAFETPVSLEGTYKFVIPEATFYDGTYDETAGQSGHCSPELVYNFSMGDGSGVSAIVAENGVVTVYDIAGRVVLLDADAAQVTTLAKGVYIINGKKYVVK
ncbi:MAG: hypothetical protein K2K81_06725 [Muribaculaceae bacterium]|nr:hypothetical protein [Muribaculaceae bacterium]